MSIWILPETIFSFFVFRSAICSFGILRHRFTGCSVLAQYIENPKWGSGNEMHLKLVLKNFVKILNSMDEHSDNAI